MAKALEVFICFFNILQISTTVEMGGCWEDDGSTGIRQELVDQMETVSY